MSIHFIGFCFALSASQVFAQSSLTQVGNFHYRGNIDRAVVNQTGTHAVLSVNSKAFVLADLSTGSLAKGNNPYDVKKETLKFADDQITPMKAPIALANPNIVSPNGKYAIKVFKYNGTAGSLGMRRGEVYLYRAETVENKTIFKPMYEISQAAERDVSVPPSSYFFSDEGNLLLSYTPTSVSIIDPENRESFFTLHAPFPNDAQSIVKARLSKDNNFLLVNFNNSWSLYDVATRTEVAHDKVRNSVGGFSKSGRWLAIASLDPSKRTVDIFDLSSVDVSKAVKTLELAPEGAFKSIQFSPAETFFSITVSGATQIIDLSDLTEVTAADGKAFQSVFFSGDDSKIVDISAVAKDGTTKMKVYTKAVKAEEATPTANEATANEPTPAAEAAPAAEPTPAAEEPATTEPNP